MAAHQRSGAIGHFIDQVNAAGLVDVHFTVDQTGKGNGNGAATRPLHNHVKFLKPATVIRPLRLRDRRSRSGRSWGSGAGRRTWRVRQVVTDGRTALGAGYGAMERPGLREQPEDLRTLLLLDTSRVTAKVVQLEVGWRP